MNKFSIVDSECDGDVLVVMGEAKPKEAGMASSSQDAMIVLRNKNRNRSDFPISTHFPLRPGERDRVIVHRSCDEIRPLPPWPTDHTPGTPEKLEIMAWRYRMGYALHHPFDAKLNTCGRMSELELASA